MDDADEQLELEALRRGDEAVFLATVSRYHARLLRLALHHVACASVAEEVVQETWLAVLRGLPGFEGRSSFRTWLYRILTNSARKRGRREARCVPFSSLAREEAEADEHAVPA
ncbi:MAG: RNA polymerase sigma factor, partial [Myxococcales bacterium]|nr:RNA polymerase sigma factor [Myxococcales bacterium]